MILQKSVRPNLVIVDIYLLLILKVLMGYPIYFWEDSYYLNKKFKDFFKPLIEVGICQVSPIKASSFVEKIKDNPKDWWNSSEVQNAKQIFLNNNLGSPQLLLDYLINLANKKLKV